jgi:polyisoprenoid-binding protein YceI
MSLIEFIGQPAAGEARPFSRATRASGLVFVSGISGGVSGTATIDGSDPAASSLNVTVETATVDTRSEQRDGHLKSADFFDVENFPEITFVGTGFAVDGDEVEVTGDLTIKGVTHPLTIPFEFTGAAIDPFGNERVGFEGSVVVNRKDWNLTWNAALETGIANPVDASIVAAGASAGLATSDVRKIDEIAVYERRGLGRITAKAAKKGTHAHDE